MQDRMRNLGPPGRKVTTVGRVASKIPPLQLVNAMAKATGLPPELLSRSGVRSAFLVIPTVSPENGQKKKTNAACDVA
jgi:hypothetical protein